MVEYAYTSPFALNQRVIIDGAADVVAVVSAICWREGRPEIEASWFANGCLQFEWIALSRLAAAE